ncbi:MAG: ubiquinone/menaquinone biosynthesis methyltransferase [Verrucomicrobiaceae bacterium]|nr:ubiquinone/menaquinone biosynthesis methyltransferase [Verrucomicrobiaceae bacterium]
MQDARYVKEAFAGIARRYVLTNHVLSLGTDVLWRRKTARLVESFAPGHVLDLATGSGDLALAIQGACPSARVLGADFSVPMMRQAQRQGFQNVVAADAMALPLADASFDVVTVAFGLRNMASWPGALKEMLRVLRPGGRLVVLDFSLPSWLLLRGPYVFYLKHIMPRVAGVLTGKREAYEYLCGSIERFPSGARMEALMRDCGFAEPVSRPLSFGIATLYTAGKP